MGWNNAALAVALWVAAVTAGAAGLAPAPDLRGIPASPDVQRTAQWILQSADHRGLAFAIVDKRAAHLYVFDSKGRLKGATPALIGQTPGDEIAPEVGKHTAQGRVPPEERTTPAGRFVSSPGRNLEDEPVVWLDYESAFAIHRLRQGASHDARASRLATPTAADNRVSYGCVIVPVAFYTGVVEPLLGRSRAVVYVLPESGQLRELLNSP